MRVSRRTSDFSHEHRDATTRRFTENSDFSITDSGRPSLCLNSLQYLRSLETGNIDTVMYLFLLFFSIAEMDIVLRITLTLATVADLEI